jgi:hypothetical protein
MKDKEYEKIICPKCDGSGYVHAYNDGRVVASCCDDIQLEKKGEKE